MAELHIFLFQFHSALLLACRYPDGDQYNAVLTALICRYPFLRDSTASGFVSLGISNNEFAILLPLFMQGTFKKCLRDKFGNQRSNNKVPLTSQKKVLEMRERYGRPGGGRSLKRLADEAAAEDDEIPVTPSRQKRTVSPFFIPNTRYEYLCFL